MNNKKEKDSSDEKDLRLIKALSGLKQNEFVSLTRLTRERAKISSVERVRDKLQFNRTMREIPFEEVVDEHDDIKGVIGSDTLLSIRKEMRIIQKGILDIKNQLDEIRLSKKEELKEGQKAIGDVLKKYKAGKSSE